MVSEAARRLNLAECPQGWQRRADRLFHVRHFSAGGIQEVEPKGFGRNYAWLSGLVVAWVGRICNIVWSLRLG